MLPQQLRPNVVTEICENRFTSAASVCGRMSDVGGTCQSSIQMNGST